MPWFKLDLFLILRKLPETVGDLIFGFKVCSSIKGCEALWVRVYGGHPSPSTGFRPQGLWLPTEGFGLEEFGE